MDTPRPNLSISYLGHATVLVGLQGGRFLTDPVLRDRVGPLRRLVPAIDPASYADVDAVLISHVHHDHLDGPSLRRLDPGTPVLAPRGAGRLLRRRGLREVIELSVGEAVTIGPARILATPAEHGDTRHPGGRVITPLGYVLEAGARVYFAGDTDRFDGMDAIGATPLDVALLPVSGWGPRLPPGHLDPVAAADVLRMLRPEVAVPIHWGTLAPAWARRPSDAERRAPAEHFAREAAQAAPEVAVRLLEPGESFTLRPLPR